MSTHAWSYWAFMVENGNLPMHTSFNIGLRLLTRRFIEVFQLRL